MPAAIAGAGLATYTASLLSATSTPLWAAAPRSLAVRFGASSVASGASALSLFERFGSRRRALDALTLAALATELAATVTSHDTYERRGVAAALDGPWGKVEKVGATQIGVMLPLALQAARLATRDRPTKRWSDLADLGVLAGALLLRVSIMGAGDESAARPDISLRFTQPENLPR